MAAIAETAKIADGLQSGVEQRPIQDDEQLSYSAKSMEIQTGRQVIPPAEMSK
jgi:hypothetical protein